MNEGNTEILELPFATVLQIMSLSIMEKGELEDTFVFNFPDVCFEINVKNKNKWVEEQ